MKPLLIFILLAGASPAKSAPDVHLFDYGSKAPLDFHDDGAQDVGGIKVYDISYASPKGGRCPRTWLYRRARPVPGRDLPSARGAP